jgi:hypothetical protein
MPTLLENVRGLFTDKTAAKRQAAIKDKLPVIVRELEHARTELAALQGEIDSTNAMHVMRGEAVEIPKTLEKLRIREGALSAAHDALLAQLSVSEREAMEERKAELMARVAVLKKQRSEDYAKGLALHLSAAKYFARAGGEDLALAMTIKGGSRMSTFYPIDGLDLVHVYFEELSKISQELAKLGIASAERITGEQREPEEASRFIDDPEAEQIAELIAEVHKAVPWA